MAGAIHTDVLVIGSGMAGMSVAARLSRAGRTVRVLEAHDHPGGYAQTFPLGKGYASCAQVHYVFGCEPGGAIHTLLAELDLTDDVRMLSLDPDGFDHVVVAGDRLRIPRGFDRLAERLVARFPDAEAGIRGYVDLLVACRDELDRMPDPAGWLDVALSPIRFPHLLRWRHATLGEAFDRFELPRRVRAFLAGQSGDELLPPSRVSFLLHVALTSGYDRSACYPERHFAHLVGRVVDRIREAPGCAVETGVEVDRIDVREGRVTGVHTADGRTFTADTYVSNADPASTVALAGPASFPASFRARVAYPYTTGTFTMYLGVRGLDLAAHGFGAWNTWHYPHDDLDRIHADQAERNDLSDPWLFLATPTLHTVSPGLAPPGGHLMVVATTASHAAFRELRDAGQAAYDDAREKVARRILEVIEASYLPGLHDHLELRVVGTPLTNERFSRAPWGNAYGAELSPEHVGPGRLGFETPIPNLFLCNATAGYPSVAGTVRSGQRLAARLLGRSA